MAVRPWWKTEVTAVPGPVIAVMTEHPEKKALAREHSSLQSTVSGKFMHNLRQLEHHIHSEREINSHMLGT